MWLRMVGDNISVSFLPPTPLGSILLEADDIIVKPFEPKKIADVVRDTLAARKVSAHKPKERVAAILERCTSSIVEDWLTCVRKNKTLSQLLLSDRESTGYLPKLFEDLIVRLIVDGSCSDEGNLPSSAAARHGEMRRQQDYTPGMFVQDSRILQVTIFRTLQTI
jgi:hypothetical protein